MFLKRVVYALFIAVFALVGQAASDDAMMVFSTHGPDRYADGTPVQEGEMYALVWSRTGSAFVGFDMNGAVIDAANNALVVAMPLAKYSERCGGVRCPTTLFQIDATRAKGYADGAYALVLLDTRVSDGKGGLVPSGKLTDLKGWGLIEASRVSEVGTGISGRAMRLGVGGENGSTTTTASAVPAGETIPQPRITGIKVEDGFVRLTVAGTSPRLLYNVAAGERPGERGARRVAQAPKQGDARADRTIELIVPVRADQRFFKVTQN